MVFCQVIQSFNVLLETHFSLNYYNMFLLKIKRSVLLWLNFFRVGVTRLVWDSVVILCSVIFHNFDIWLVFDLWYNHLFHVIIFFQIFIKQFMPEKGIIVIIVFHFVTWLTECDLWQW